VATEFQTHKKVNNNLNCEHVSVAVFSCKRCERSERQVLKFLIEAFWDVALFQLVKGDFPQEYIVYNFSIEQWNIMAFNLQKLVIFVLFIKF
jgi:hypothetical protein